MSTKEDTRFHETKQIESVLGCGDRMMVQMVFSFLALFKSILAIKGVETVYRYGLDAHQLVPIKLLHARLWLWAYVLIQFPDLAKSLYYEEHVSSIMHHIITAAGFAINASFGSNRTQLFSVMCLSGEVVAPAYQYYAYLNKTHRGSSRVALSCVWMAALLTFSVRLPIQAFVAYTAVRDMWLALIGDADTVKKEIQPWLLMPSIGGAVFILKLDSMWMREWAFPKMFK